MPEKELMNEQSVVDDTTVDYIDTINKLKQNTVDKAKYEELRLENKKLLDSIVNGQEIEIAKEHQARPVQEIRKELFGKEHNNLEYVKLSLELREALMAKGEPDPFLPIGRQIAPTIQDEETAARAAQIYQECIDYANGDSEVFTNELQRRTRDVRVR